MIFIIGTSFNGVVWGVDSGAVSGSGTASGSLAVRALLGVLLGVGSGAASGFVGEPGLYEPGWFSGVLAQEQPLVLEQLLLP